MTYPHHTPTPTPPLDRRLRVTIPTFASDELLERMCKEHAVEYDMVFKGCNVATMKRGSETPYGMVEDAVIGIRGGKIAFVGGAQGEEGKRVVECSSNVKDLGGALVTPGLIDCHTHVIYGGDRSLEWEMKLAGASYEEVAKAGGGIINTVSNTRAATVDDLFEGGRKRVAAILSEGVTTMEIKSGYGLEYEAERKMLLAAAKVEKEFKVKVEKTFLGAHAVPNEYKGRSGEYMDTCVEMLQKLREEGLVDCCDCFTESIGFSVEETEKLFGRAKEMGVKIRLHGDQLNNYGCGELAKKFACLSIDHCEYSGEKAIKAMAEGGQVAVLLPASNYFIKETKLPEVGMMRDMGVDIAVATNCNPGSGPCCSILLVLNMACTRFGMTPEEALRGVTVNAAKALGKEDEIGSVEVGKAADLCVWDAQRPSELSYYMGLNLLKECYVDGCKRE